jgi:hypothetical protein
MNISNNPDLREKTVKSYPPILWIISTFMGIIGSYLSRIGSAYFVISDAILLLSAWLIFIGLCIIFLSYNDENEDLDNERVGIYSAINHPRMFGEYFLIIGLNLQAVHLVISAFLILLLSSYHKWLIHRNWKTIFSPESYFRFNIWKMTDNKRGVRFNNSIKKCVPYFIFSICYLLLLIELRIRSIGRSLMDLIN